MNTISIFDSILDDVFSATPNAFYNSGITPRVDVSENQDSYFLEMELPGRAETDINIELDQDKLSIKSKNEQKNETEEKEPVKYLLKERRYGDFERNFTLPKDADTDTIFANFKNGILTINIQKKAAVLPKKISIEAC